VHRYRRTDRIEDLRRLSARAGRDHLDNDDNYAAAESATGIGLDGRRHNKAIFRDILRAARLADLTTTPYELLAEHDRSAGASNEPRRERAPHT